DQHHGENTQSVKASVRRGIYYGWVIVLVSFLTMLLVMGTRFSFGVFYSSMLAEMGWSRAATAGIFSVSMLVYAAVALGVGAAFIPGVLIPLILLVHRSRPEDLGLHPDGAPRPWSIGRQASRFADAVAATPYTTALTTRGFWALFGVIFAIACTVMLLTVHQNQYLIDIGFNPAFAA